MAGALESVLKQLLSQSIPQTLTTFNSISQLYQTHASIIVSGLSNHLITTSRLLACAAIPPYANLPYAYSIFRQIPNPNLFTFNTIIRGFSQNPRFSSSCVLLYIRMLGCGCVPDKFTFPFLIRSVIVMDGELGLRLGRQIHGQIVRFGLEFDLFVVNNLIGMYMAGNDMCAAEQVFNECGEKTVDVVSWTAMVTGCAVAGDVDRAREYFDRMPCRNIVSWNAMVSGLAKTGRINEARNVFDKMPERDDASWSSMVSGYYQQGLYRDALCLFKTGFCNNGGEIFNPNEAALVSAVSSCAKLRSMENGVWLHDFIKKGKFRMSVKLSSALVDMYGKCGSVTKALEVFNSMNEKTDVSWSSMIAGLAFNGFGKHALWLFWKMLILGQTPSNTTFVAVLAACSHAGLVTEGCWLFNLMTKEYNIRPELEHYGCMVDLLCRAGHVREAIGILEAMPSETRSMAVGSFGAIVSGCKSYGVFGLGGEIGKLVIELEPRHAGRYASLSNIFAAAEKWEERVVISDMVKKRHVSKIAGNSIVI